MKHSQKIDVIQHALDNGINDHEYEVYELLQAPGFYERVQPYPCDILPQQFGYWFHTGPGLASNLTPTYAHKIYSTNEARILGTDGVVVYKGDWIDSMSLNYVAEDSVNVSLGRESTTFSIPASQRFLRGDYFLGFNSSHKNYAHWTTDQLPLLYYYKTKLMESGVRLLLPGNATSFLQQYVELLNIPKSVIDYIDDSVVAVQRLIYSSSFSFDSIPPSIIKLIDGFKKDCLPDLAKSKKGIFVSRKDTSVRTLLNEEAISKILSSEGFEVIVPGRMSVNDQISAFQSADCVIGTHGAALANLMFCRPETQVIELFPEYTVSPHFWMLASYFGLKYGAIFGTSFDQDVALTDQSGSWEGSFVINAETLKKSLRLLGRG